jgi:hypothetical protein
LYIRYSLFTLRYCILSRSVCTGMCVIPYFPKALLTTRVWYIVLRQTSSHINGTLHSNLFSMPHIEVGSVTVSLRYWYTSPTFSCFYGRTPVRQFKGQLYALLRTVNRIHTDQELLELGVSGHFLKIRI